MNLKTIIISITLLFCQFGFCQTCNYIVKKRVFTYADGLPSLDITCGVADKYGFLWFGTRNGLCRYDGTKFVLFSKKKYNLRGAKIANLTYDGDLGVIISYEKLFGRFSSENKACPETDVININTFKVATLAGYYKDLPFKEKDCYSIRNTPDNKVIFRNKGVYQEWNYAKKQGFVKQKTQNDSLKFLELNKKSIGGYFQKRQKTNYYKDDFATTLTNEKAGRSRNFSNTEQFYLFKKNQRITFSKNDYTGSIIINDTTKLFHPLYGLIPVFANNDKETFTNIHINSYFKDAQQNYWFCTHEGLIEVTIKKREFTNFFTKDDKYITGNNAVRGIYAEKGVIYANMYDYSVLKTQKGLTFFKGSSNFAIAKIDGWFWSSNFNLRRFNLKAPKMEFLYHPQNGEIWSIFNLNKTKILLGTTNGILLYDKIKKISQTIDLSGFPPAYFVYKIFRNQEGQIMVVADNGVYIVSDGGKVLDLFSFDATSKNKKFPFENIYDVFQDTSGMYWIGTNYDGLFRWDKSKNTFLKFDIETGFVSNTINCIQEDNYNNLWISTDYGLVQFNKKTFSLKNYTTKDGIANNEFNRTSSFKDENGLLYFGGMNGITSFDPKDFLRKERASTSLLSIINFNLFNQKLNEFEDKTAAILLKKQIVLNEDYPFFNLSFSLMDYEDRNHNYAYKIEGLEKNWNYTFENNLKIGSLPYGKYILRIKAQAANGSWSGQEIEIPIYVVTPFYKKWWFFVILFLVAVALIFIFFKRRNYVLNRKNEKLEIVVKNRTKDLETSLIEQLSLTQEIHHRVKNNLQFMAAMIEMQIDATKSSANKSVLKDTSRRINAMTLVHEMLYNKEVIETISGKAYLLELVQKMDEMVNDSHLQIDFDIHIDDVDFNISDCVSIGMITSELLSNSIKYAFKGVKKPRITIDLKYNPITKTVFYAIADNGIGFEKGNFTGLGLRLIDIFTRQLNGDYSIITQNGFCFTLEFKIV